MNQLRLRIHLRKELRRLFAVLLRILFKIHVMKQTCDLPEIRLISISQILCEPAQGLPHGDAVLQMEGLLIILP